MNCLCGGGGGGIFGKFVKLSLATHPPPSLPHSQPCFPRYQRQPLETAHRGQNIVAFNIDGFQYVLNTLRHFL